MLGEVVSTLHMVQLAMLMWHCCLALPAKEPTGGSKTVPSLRKLFTHLSSLHEDMTFPCE